MDPLSFRQQATSRGCGKPEVLQIVCGELYPHPRMSSTRSAYPLHCNLLHIRRGFQIDGFPLSFNDSVPDLSWGLLQFGLLVREINLFQADPAMGPMS